MKLNLFKISICVFLLSVAARGFGQNMSLNFPTEKISLAVNDSLFTSGETLLYRGFLLNSESQPSEYSKVLRVVLIDGEENELFSHKLKVDNCSASGYFFIPSSTPTGIYKLMAYTHLSLNNSPANYSEKPIYIINPFLKGEPVSSETETDSTTISYAEIFPKTNSQENKIQLSTHKTKYTARQKVKLEINNIGSIAGNYVLSVRKVNPLFVNTAEAIPMKIDSHYELPELRGEIISGHIIGKNTTLNEEGKLISLSLPGKNFITKTVRTNRQGEFSFSINEPYTTTDAVFQILDDNRSDYKITIDDYNAIPAFQMGNSHLFLNPNLENWLKERAVETQIENAYFTSKETDSVVPALAAPFFHDLGDLYVLDEYTRFKTLRETFVEVIETAALRRNGAEYYFIIYDDAGVELRGIYKNLSPLVMVDGIIVNNANEIIDLEPYRLENIRVIRKTYVYGPQVYSGIIAFETKKGDFKPNLEGSFIKTVALKQTLLPREIYSPDYTTDALKRIPDFRVQLYWNPSLDISSEKEVEFYTSDSKGTYEAKLSGYTRNGEFVETTTYFEVD